MSLEKLLSRIYDLPSIPKVVQDLIENFNSTRADANAISKNIQTDPVIAAKVLRLANSVRYGAGRQVASLDAAVVLLGIDTLKTLVIASGITSSFKSIPGLDAKAFWRNSFMIANYSKLIAQNSHDLDAETAFTCGMLHNIGVALMYLAEPEQMKQLDKSLLPGEDRTQAEKNRFGFNNYKVGSQLAFSWKFPDIVVQALQNQGDPLESEPFSYYAAVIKLAIQLNRALIDGLSPEEAISSLPESLTAPLRLNPSQLEQQVIELYEADDDIDELLAA